MRKAESSEQDRAIGCLLGLAVGDALGTTLEFERRDCNPPLTDMVGGGPFGLPAGYWTDDTSMAICLAESLLACRRFEGRDLMQRFVRWWRDGENSSTGELFDIGRATRAALARFRNEGVVDAGETDERAAGNGSIMRLAPVALFHFPNGESAVRDAVAQSRTTHGAAECLDACALLAHVLVTAIAGAARAAVLRPVSIVLATPRVKALADGVWRTKTRDQIRSSGYVVDTLEAALWCVDRTESFADAVLLAANLGDDADTVGAVTGQIAGALYGESGIPDAWLEKLTQSERLRQLAADLYVFRA
jgi:ADP-ribosyl-[dinitrogen reductase] hydrolase